jgi:hypothetical protein
MVLFFGAVGDPEVRGRPLRLVEAVPARRERADCRRAISASIAARMSRVFIHVRYQRSSLVASYVLVGAACPAGRPPRFEVIRVAQRYGLALGTGNLSGRGGR